MSELPLSELPMSELPRSELAIAGVTGSRADFGLMCPVFGALARHPRFTFSLIVTGAHLDATHGHTIDEVEAEGFAIAARVPATEGGDDSEAIARATARGLAGFGEALVRLKPDLLLLAGDRYEILAAATAALFARVPVAHFFGGDVTSGAFDEAIRHAITKMAHIHFPTNPAAARRLVQLGEDPRSVHLVGSPALDGLKHFKPMERTAFFSAVRLPLRRRLVLVAFHSATLDHTSALMHLEELLAALEPEGDDTALLLTGANADTEGRALTARLVQFAAAAQARAFYPSLGHRLYWNALSHAAVLVGNSSSGLYEAPSFKLASVNIGDRQQGRLRAPSVIDCPPERQAIARALERARHLDVSHVVNPYGDGNATQRILEVLEGLTEPRRLIKKRFHDMVAQEVSHE